MVELTIIGTAHVIDLAYPLEIFVRNSNPNIIALELDRERWFALNSEDRKVTGPFYIKLLARLQKYLGDTFGSPPGSEMLVAAKIAASLGAKLAFIDKPILPVFRETWKKMPWREFQNIIIDSLISFVGGGNLNLNNSIRTGDFSNELTEFSERYPSLKNNLIDRRDTYMSTKIVKLFRNNNQNRIVVIVGEGHLQGISGKLSNLNPKIITLSDLLRRKNNSVSFSVNI